MVDVIIAMIVLSLFVGVIGNLYYQIALQSNMVRINSVAVYYVVKIAEDLDRISYEEVRNELNDTIKATYQIPDLLTITLNVQNYNENDSSKEDIIKIVTIKAEYQCFEDTKVYEIKKLKIKER